MRIILGKMGDYSVRAMLDLAMHHGRGRRKARKIASQQRIPSDSIARTLAQLVRCGLILATAGPDGGYELQRPPSKITLLDVVEAAEGEIELRQCLLRGIPCGSGKVCSVHHSWAAAQEAMGRSLRKTTFAHLVSKERASARRQGRAKPARAG